VGDKNSVNIALASLAQLPEAFQSIDCLINNAGLALGLEPAHQASFEDWETMVQTNVLGLIYLTRQVLPQMVERNRGYIINIGSIAGTYPYAGGNVYGATKAFVRQFSLNLRADLAGKNIRITNIEPGLCGGTEFSNVRFKGDEARVNQLYENVDYIRAEDIACYYDDLIEYTQYFNLLGVGTHQVNGKTIVVSERELKKKLYLCLMCVNVLEAIRFYVSFACSFAFAERELMEGNAKIIKLIARDEALHLTSTQHMLNLMRGGAEGAEWAEIAAELQNECFELFKKAAEQEKEWAEYLFKDGSMIGLNKDILCQYVEYITNARMLAVGLQPAFEKATQNPIPWINTWLSSDNVQVAPQEVEISSYLIGQIDSEVSADDLGDFEL